MPASSCKCCMLVSLVHPVAECGAVFCADCSVFVFVSDMMANHMVLPYSSGVLVLALYVACLIITFCVPGCSLIDIL